MAEEYSHGNQRFGNVTAGGVGVHGAAAPEAKDHGLFDFSGKKEEEIKPTEGCAVNLEEEKHGDADGENKKPGFLEKLRRSNSSSSSSSDEEEAGGGEEGKKKKKGLKEKIKEKITGEEKKEQSDNGVAVEKCGAGVHAGKEEGGKGFIENVNEKLWGHGEHEKKEDPKPYAGPPEHPVGGEDCHGEEKKGILEKIKEKLPGYHAKSEEGKENEKEAQATSY